MASRIETARQIFFFTLILAVFFLSAADTTVHAVQVEPHNFRELGMDCRSCHASVRLKTRGIMRKPVGEICAGCHKLPGHSHPVDIKPALDVPKDLPLDIKGMMTCATCHDPHMPYMDKITGKKTVYLRRAGEKMTLCPACHKK